MPPYYCEPRVSPWSVPWRGGGPETKYEIRTLIYPRQSSSSSSFLGGSNRRPVAARGGMRRSAVLCWVDADSQESRINYFHPFSSKGFFLLVRNRFYSNESWNLDSLSSIFGGRSITTAVRILKMRERLFPFCNKLRDDIRKPRRRRPFSLARPFPASLPSGQIPQRERTDATPVSPTDRYTLLLPSIVGQHCDIAIVGAHHTDGAVAVDAMNKDRKENQ